MDVVVSESKLNPKKWRGHFPDRKNGSFLNRLAADLGAQDLSSLQTHFLKESCRNCDLLIGAKRDIFIGEIQESLP